MDGKIGSIARDRDLWLLAGRGSTQLVIIVKWSKSGRSKVKGEIELFGLDETGQVSCLQRQVRENLACNALSVSTDQS